MKFFSLTMAMALVVAASAPTTLAAGATTTLAANTQPWKFFATYNYKFIPLTARDYNGVGLLMHDNPTGEPVTFSLEEWKYAVTTESSTPGYAGIYEEVLAFGPKVTKTALDLDPDQCVMNAAFYSCQFPNDTARLITVANVNDGCFPVKILLWPVDSERLESSV